MPLIAQYAGVGEISPQFQVAVSSGGSLTTSGTLYFSFQLQNRAGLNIASYSEAIAYSANQKITITIPETVQKPGWDTHAYIISVSTTSDPTSFIQIARIPGFQYGPGINPQSVRTVLPATITLSRDSHIAIAPTVANPAALPTGADRLDGAVRWITSLSGFFEYRADSIAPPNVNVLTADTGRWHRIGTPLTYISDTTTGGGSDRPITTINPITVKPNPPYPIGNDKVLPTWESQYWLYNTGDGVVPDGIAFGIELEYNRERSPDLLNGTHQVKFLGYVQTDGSIRTTTAGGQAFPNINTWFDWIPRLTTPFITPDDLQVGEAIAIAVRPYFSVWELNNQFTPGSVISVLPSIRTQSGDFNPLGFLLPKGTVFDIGDRYRVVPNIGLSFDILEGMALVANYNAPKPRRTFGGLLANTAGQKIIINGNGGVYAESPSYTPTASEATRAIVGTVGGESSAGAYSNYVAVTGGAIALTLTYPTTVRANHPDVIAGSDKAKFNPPRINIYLQRQDTNEVRRFSGFLVIEGTTQQFTITDWLTGTVVSELPTASSEFSLFVPQTVAVASSTDGTVPSTSYRAAYSFVYDGGQITSISHASPPCITEWDGDFAPPSIAIGTVTTLPPGSEATVTNVGSSNEIILNFGIPQGEGGGGEVNFDAILTTSNGEILIDSNGNILYL